MRLQLAQEGCWLADALILRTEEMLKETAAAGKPDFSGSKKILIVEDNDLNMKLFNVLLETQGYHTLRTGKGTEAIELARQHRPDLIVLDIQLPQISGYDVLRWLKEDDALRAIPVIAVTAFAVESEREQILRSGCDALIAKPISTVDFLHTVTGLIT